MFTCTYCLCQKFKNEVKTSVWSVLIYTVHIFENLIYIQIISNTFQKLHSSNHIGDNVRR